MATLYQRGQSWYLSWAEGGEQFRRSLGPITPREAERLRSAKAAELTHGVRIIPRLPTVQQFMDAYEPIYEAKNPTTIRGWRNEIKPFLRTFGHRPIDSIRPVEVETWIAERLKTRARETVGKEIRRFKAAFRWGVRQREIDQNPVEVATVPRGTRSVAVAYFTAKQVAELRKTPHGPLWALMACTGLRRGEAARVLKSRDVVKEGGRKVLRIESRPDATGKGRTKSGKWRAVPLSKTALECLALLPDRIAPVHPDTLGDWFTAETTVGGTLHRLRHTFVSHLVMAGVPLREVQSLAGHADYKTTEVYAHLAPAGAGRAVDKLPF